MIGWLAVSLVTIATSRAQADTIDGLTIPQSHPRLFWTPARIAQAQAWYASHSFTPSSTDWVGQAAKYVLTGNASACAPAISWAVGETLDPSGTASDQARWDGESVILTYDWCYNAMSDAQRSTIMNKWNGYVSTLNTKSWGGPGMENSNYYWGYLRNSLEWGIATYYEQPSIAGGFIDNALVTRWQNGVVPFFNGRGKGGVFQEGSEYGRYMAWYPDVPFVSAGLMGRDVLRETNFYRESVAYLIYMTSPQPTYVKGFNTPYYQVLPFADDENSQSADGPYGDFMAMIQGAWSGTPLGQYAQQWLNMVNPTVSYHFQSTFTAVSPLSFSTLPLDYFAQGIGYMFTRNKWGSGSTYAQIQTGICTNCGHDHADMGNFHIARNGYWLTKESTGYSDTIPGWGGTGSVDISNGTAHNVMFYNGGGPNVNYVAGSATTLRLESHPNYSYLAADLSKEFQASDSRYANAAAGTTVREYLFIKPLETLVLLDRMQSTSASTREGIAIHFENSPVVSGTTIVGTNGSQALEVNAVLPQSVTTRVVNEGAKGRFRLELETSGQTQTYFLTVLQARDASAPSLTVASSEDANSITLTLQHPSFGSAKIVFNKGASSNGGQFGYSPTQTMPASLSPLYTGVQAVSVTDNGISWASVSGGSSPPAAPTGLRIQ
jgi:hypothetical protein